MRHGDISNKSAPYICVDTDCIIYSTHPRLTAFVEQLPINWFDEWLLKFYKFQPNSRGGLSKLVDMGINVCVVACGRKKEIVTKLLEYHPMTELCYFNKITDLIEYVNYNNELTYYFSMVPAKTKCISGAKAKDFLNWTTILNACTYLNKEA